MINDQIVKRVVQFDPGNTEHQIDPKLPETNVFVDCASVDSDDRLDELILTESETADSDIEI